MIKRLGKILAAILCFFSFQNCKVVEVTTAHKEKHIASLPNLNNYTIYVFSLKIKTPITITNIELANKKDKKKIVVYDFVNTLNHKGHTVLENKKLFTIGSYKISFKQVIQQEKKQEKVIVYYSMDNKKYKKEIPIVKFKKVIEK